MLNWLRLMFGFERRPTAPASSPDVQGTILDSAGNILPPAPRVISISDATAAGPPFATAVVNDDGSFEIGDLPTNLRGEDVRIDVFRSTTQGLSTEATQTVKAPTQGPLAVALSVQAGQESANIVDSQVQTAKATQHAFREQRKLALDEQRPIHEKAIGDIEAAVTQRSLTSYLATDGTPSPGIIRPGLSARRAAFTKLDQALSTDGTATVLGLVDVGDDETDLINDDGTPTGSITQDDIKRLLFGADHERYAPTRFRGDPLAAASRDRRPPYDRNDVDETVETPPDEDVEPSPATKEQILKAVGALVDDRLNYRSPASSRPTPESIAHDLNALTLTEGPADTVAVYDFERLFLAADLPASPHIDRGLVYDYAASYMRADALGATLRARPSIDDARSDEHSSATVDVLTQLEAEVGLLQVADPVPGELGLRTMALSLPIPSPSDVVGAVTDIAEDVAGTVVDVVTGSDGPQRPRPKRPRPTRPERRPPARPRAKRRRFDDLQRFIRRLRRSRRSEYSFTPLASTDDGPGVTYGVVVTYRQHWRPTGYQAGELVKTLPLGPSASVKYSSRRKISKTYEEKRAEASESTYSSEREDTSRDVSKVVRNAKLSTSYEVTNKAGGGVPGAASAQSTTVWKIGAERSSQHTKDSFREAVRKSAEDLKHSSSVEVTITTDEEFEVTETSEVSNPNEELVATFLFYELQRRFAVSEALHKVTPVVLVSQKPPNPSEIDEVWLGKHDWIIRRVLLDPSFEPAMDFVISGDLLADLGEAEELAVAVDQQADVVDTIENRVSILLSEDLLPDPRNVFELLKVRAYDRKDRDWREDEQKVREVFGDDVADRFADRRRTVEDLEASLKREYAALVQITDKYNSAFTKYAKKAIQVERLFLHIKENILYYMQAIFTHETPDQRYLRLRDQFAPDVAGSVSYSAKKSTRPSRAPTFRTPLEIEATGNLHASGEVPLGQIADLSSLLGYVGNAMVFPMDAWNSLVELLLVPYVSAVTGVSDQDPRGNETIEQLDGLILAKMSQMSTEEFEELKPRIEEAYAARVSDPRPDEETIVMPTGSLFVEALPGSHPILEDFKLLHRAIDVQKEAAALTDQWIEQLRLASRLIADEYDDPDTEKIIIREDAASVTVDPT